MSLPTASTIVSKSSVVSEISEMNQVDVSSVMSALKTMGAADLFKVMKAAMSEAEKKTKETMKSTKKDKKKRSGSMPKGIIPPQLMKPRAWMDFVKKYATENGWESFMIHKTKKDKITGEKVEETVEMPGSTLYEGVHIFEGSVSAEHPQGRMLSHADVMSLSKTWWTPKTSEGSHEKLYQEFEAQYVSTENVVLKENIEILMDVPVAAAETTPDTPVVLVAEPDAKAVKKVVKKLKK